MSDNGRESEEYRSTSTGEPSTTMEPGTRLEAGFSRPHHPGPTPNMNSLRAEIYDHLENVSSVQTHNLEIVQSSFEQNVTELENRLEDRRKEDREFFKSLFENFTSKSPTSGEPAGRGTAPFTAEKPKVEIASPDPEESTPQIRYPEVHRASHFEYRPSPSIVDPSTSRQHRPVAPVLPSVNQNHFRFPPADHKQTFATDIPSSFNPSNQYPPATNVSPPLESRLDRDDDILNPGRTQMTINEALQYDYLDGRRLNFFAMHTSLADVRRVFPQILCEKDLLDGSFRTISSNNYKPIRLHTDISVDDIYDQQMWLKLHMLQSLVKRDMVPYHLWLATMSSCFASNMVALMNSAAKYGWNWVQFCAVVSHVRQASGFAQATPGETLRQWRLGLKGTETPLDIVVQINDLLPTLPEQFSGGLIDMFHEVFTLISPSFWHHILQIRRPFPAFSVSLWWADIQRSAKMERHVVPIWSKRIRDIAPEVVNSPLQPRHTVFEPAIPALPANDPTAFPAKASDICHKCGKKGHWQRNCRSPRSDDKKEHTTKIHRQRFNSGKSRRFRDRNGRRVFLTYDDDSDHASTSESDSDDGHDDDITDNEDDNEADNTPAMERAFWVNVGHHKEDQTTPPRDEGQHASYRAFALQPTTRKSVPISIFLDTGSISCWIAQGLVDSLGLTTYPAARTSLLSGIGGGGHRVVEDVLVHLFFVSTPGLHTSKNAAPAHTGRVSVACGVVPDGVFPAPLTLGREFQKATHMALNCDGSVTFLAFPIPITLAELKDNHRCYATISLQTCYDYLVGHDNFYEPVPSIPGDMVYTSSNAEHPEVQSFRRDFPQLFDPAGKKVARASVITHHIDTSSASPIRIPPRRYSLPQQNALKEFVASGLAHGTIRISNSPWSSPALVVPKPDGRYRPCIDFRAVNAVTRKNAFPLPNIDDQVQRAAGHRLYTTLDLRDGFWQIPMAEEAIEKTAFSTPEGHFEFLVMPFGLTNAPATFQEFMNRILIPVRTFTAGLLDDICVWGDATSELTENTRKVLAILQANGLILQMRKCRWFQNQVRFLGLVIDKDGIHTDPLKIQAIRERPEPKTITDVRAFIHASAYFRRFIPDFSKIVGPLYRLTLKSPPPGTPIVLSLEHRTAIKSIIHCLTTAPTLKKYDFNRRCVIDTDASATHIGGVLQQPYLLGDKEMLYPVWFESHKLSPTQQRYSAQERELLAISHCCSKWRHFIEGCDLTIRTDHESLTLLRSKNDQPPRIQRFLSHIEHYNPIILYRPGKANRVPDWLSRPPSNHIDKVHAGEEEEEGRNQEEDTSSEVDRIVIPDVSREEGERQRDQEPRRLDDKRLSDGQISDYDLTLIARFFKNGAAHDLDVSDGAIYSRFQLVEGNLHRICGIHLVPVKNREQTFSTMRDFHRSQGHPTVGTLARALQHSVWHPEYRLLAQEAVITCPECSLRVPPSQLRQQFTPVPRQDCFAAWAIDYTGPFTYQGQKHQVLCCIEYVTGLLLTATTTSASSLFAKTMLWIIRSCFPAIRVLVSDNGAAFIDQDFREFCRQIKIERILSPPEYPERNGRVERANGQLKTHLYPLMNENQGTAFPVILDQATNLYNNSPQLHGYSPSFLTFGCEQWHPASEERRRSRHRLQGNEDIAIIYQEPDKEVEDRAADMLRADLKDKRQETIRKKDHRDAHRAIRFDDAAYINHFAPGDWVLRVRIRHHKHEPFYDGPWRVLAVDKQKNTYRLISTSNAIRRNPVHGTNLIPCLTYDGQPIQEFFAHSRHMLDSYRARLRLMARDQSRL